MFLTKHSEKRFALLLHLSVWILIFMGPLLMIPWEFTTHWTDLYWRFLCNQLVLVGIFYLNYSCLISHYLFKGRWQRFVVINLILIVLVGIGMYWVNDLFLLVNMRDFPHPPRMRYEWLSRSLRDMVLYILTVGLSVAIRMTSYWYQGEAKRKELEKVHTEAELKHLKSQLNPHFLFNTLNNIYALVEVSPEKAQNAIHQLSKLLRYVLYDNKVEVPLPQEIDFINNYLDLIRLRFSSRVKITFSIRGDYREFMIAPLLFVTLIENAFKHGISAHEPSFVDIELDLSDPDCLIFKTVNSYFPKGTEDRSGSGIGLENLRKRLELIYHDRAALVAEVRSGTFYAEILIRYPRNGK